MTQSPNQQIAKFPVNGLGAIVMAAGLGKRMRSKAAKVLHRVAGRAMFLYAVDLARRLASEGVVVVVGHQGDRVKAVLEADVAATVERADLRGYPAREKGLTAHVRQRAGLAPAVFFAEQPEPLGTGHAVMQARRVLLRLRKTPAQAFLVLNGDTPLLQEATLRDLIRLHREEKAAVTMLTARLDEPSGYGRVVRGKDGRVARIVEERDATE
ncbi:MAG: NTP transferase domain-containing protein, partial [Nitrospirales bacterium]